MPDNAAGGQQNQTVVPGVGAGAQQTQGIPDPTKVGISQAGQPAGSTLSPGDAPGQKAQHVPTITIGDQIFRADDVKGILEAKKGLELSNAELKRKLDEIESKDLSDKDKAMKDAENLRKENAELKKNQINILIDAEFAEFGVQIKAGDWNHGIDDPSKVKEAVQKFIKERPGLLRATGQPGPGAISAPPGTAAPPPGTAPANSDKAKEMTERYEKAKTPEQIAELDQEYYAYRGVTPPEGRKTI